MKLFGAILGCLLAAHVFAEQATQQQWLQQHDNGSGLYISGQVGVPSSDNLDIANLYSGDIFNDNSHKEGTGYRVALGYNFSHTLGVELGYTTFGETDEVQGPGDFIGNPPVHTHANLKQSTLELMGVYHIPLSRYWDFYTKLGVAYVMGDFNYNITCQGSSCGLIPIPEFQQGFIAHYTGQGWNPAYGFGLGRNFLDGHLFLGVDWHKVAAWSGHYNDPLKSNLQSSSMFSLNAIYRFAPYTSVTRSSGMWGSDNAGKLYAGVLVGPSFANRSSSEGTSISKGLLTSLSNVGLMLSNNFGLEIDYAAISANKDNGNKQIDGSGLMLKFVAPVSQHVNVIVKTGAISSLGYGYGFGVGYDVTKHLQVNTQYFSMNNLLPFSANIAERYNFVGLGLTVSG